jgi:hypothetical protein
MTCWVSRRQIVTVGASTRVRPMLNGVASESAVPATGRRSSALPRTDSDPAVARGRPVRRGDRDSMGAGRSDEMKVPERALPAM